MTQILAGDTGGTKTILRLAEAQIPPQDDPSALQPPQLKTLYEERFTSAEFSSLTPMVEQFLAQANQSLGIVAQPEKACFSIAGPVVNNRCNLTNLAWLLDGAALEQELQMAHVQLINDFMAVGHGIAGLEPSDLCLLQAGDPQPDAPIAVIGAGTGLGQGFLIRQGSFYQVFSSEGGHTDFAPRNELEFQLLKYLRDKMDLTRVSVERVVSGMGIVAIYQFLRDRHIAPETEQVGSAIRSWEEQAGLSTKSIDPAAVIATAAAEQGDPLSVKTMDLFAELYGAEAGNLALKLLPYGGLYIAGGVAAKNLPLLQSGSFLRAMNDKGRMRSLMERVPVNVIVNQNVGLIGAALCATRL